MYVPEAATHSRGGLVAGSISPRVGHPAPPLSWVGSHEAGLATGLASRDESHGKSAKRKRSQPDREVPQVQVAT